MREAPQLSGAVTEPQFFPRREQNSVSVSGTQAHTFEPLQVSGPVQVPQEAAVREAPRSPEDRGTGLDPGGGGVPAGAAAPRPTASE